MPANYTGVPSNITVGTMPVVSEPVDGDLDNGSTLDTPSQNLADFVAYVYQQANLVVVGSWSNGLSTAAAGVVHNGVEPNVGGITGQYVMVGAAGYIATSPSNGMALSWTQRTSGVTVNLGAIAYNGTTYVAVGSASSSANPGTILTSTDGVTWTSRTSNTGNNVNLYAVTWNATLGLFIACGNAGGIAFGGAATSNVIVTSPDGTTWTLRTSSAMACGIQSVAASNSVAIAGGTFTTNGARYLYSTNGTTWTQKQVSFFTGDFTQALAWNQTLGLFIAFDTNGNIGTSPDGNTWTQQTSVSGIVGAGAIGWNGRMLVVPTVPTSGGSKAEFLYSFDAKTWKIHYGIGLNGFNSAGTKQQSGCCGNTFSGQFVLGTGNPSTSWSTGPGLYAS